MLLIQSNLNIPQMLVIILVAITIDFKKLKIQLKWLAINFVMLAILIIMT